MSFAEPIGTKHLMYLLKQSRKRETVPSELKSSNYKTVAEGRLKIRKS